MTPYALLQKLSGLSNSEAAEFHGVRMDTVKRWSNGRDSAPDGALDELRSLIQKQDKAAGEALAQYRDMLAEHGRPEAIDLTFPASAEAAQSRGWPGVGPAQMVYARIVTGLSIDFQIIDSE